MADKRKQILDEMAIKMQNDALAYKTELKHTKEISDAKFNDYEKRIHDLEVK